MKFGYYCPEEVYRTDNINSGFRCLLFSPNLPKRKIEISHEKKWSGTQKRVVFIKTRRNNGGRASSWGN